MFKMSPKEAGGHEKNLFLVHHNSIIQAVEEKMLVFFHTKIFTA